MDFAPILEFVCICDLEATCDDKAGFSPQEIIEFPVIIYNIREKKVQAEFREYVKPTLRPKLTKFCTELTGITQETVDNAKPFLEVWQLFIKFMMDQGLIDPYTQQPIKSFAFLTCGDWDFKHMLPLQCKYLNIHIPSWLKQWINVKEIFNKSFNLQKSLGMANMLKLANLPLIGRHHSGLDDSRNILEIAKLLMARNERLYNTSFV